MSKKNYIVNAMCKVLAGRLTPAALNAHHPLHQGNWKKKPAYSHKEFFL